MNAKELAEYHLDNQASEIKQMSSRTEPFEKGLAGLRLTVLPNVYPGGLDSELMTEVIKVKKGDTVLDICTGTGVIALKAAQMGAAKVVGVDLNPFAVANSNANKEKLGHPSIMFLEGSLFGPVKGMQFDVITINPPYTNKKPSNKTEICFWDEDNQTTKKFFKEFRKYLKPGGKAYLAWADFGDMGLIQTLAKENGINLQLIGSKKTPSGLATFLAYELRSK